MRGRRTASWLLAAALGSTGSLPAARAQGGGTGDGNAAAPSYFEFGTVVALGKRDVEVQTYDSAQGATVRRNFALSRETRADAVRVGERVEVIFTLGTDGGTLNLERLIGLRGTIPRPGSQAPLRAYTGGTGAAGTVAARNPATGGKATRGAVVPARNGTGLVTQPVSLAGAAPKAVPPVVTVPLGVAATAASPKTPTVRGIAQETPGQQCNREADWGTQPISLAVLDFRYPTEHEEANDVSKTGGGSGTAVADLVYNRLEGDPDFQMRRGDREKLYRMDFAGAARLGRQLGVDAVLLGTFAAVETVSPDPDFPTPTQAYTLRAGVVETCTGQLLYKLTSVTCGAATCPGAQVTVKDTVDPLANQAAFREPIDALLGPLTHNGTPAGLTGSAGLVTAAQGTRVTIRLRTGGGVRVGEQVSVHAFRLAKNPTTNTLQRFEDTEIGRVTIDRVNGGAAEGVFVGDVLPRVGDTAEIITE